MSNVSSPAGVIKPVALSNEEFLKGVFGDPGYRDAWVTATANPKPGRGGDMTGRRWSSYQPAEIAVFEQMQSYFSISTFSGNARDEPGFVACHCIVLDDVTNPAHVLKSLSPPSWRLETSPGNEQWGYILKTPETDLGRIKALIEQLEKVGFTKGKATPTIAYRRLPEGRNLKQDPKTGKRLYPPSGFAHVLHEWEPGPGRRTTVDALMVQAGGVVVASGTYVSRPPVAPSQAELDADPLFRALSDAGALAGDRAYDGVGWQLVQCPWTDEHSDQTPRATDAAYYVRTAARPEGGFNCFHDHCANRTPRDLMSKLGVQDVVAQATFDPVPAMEPEVAEATERYKAIVEAADEYAQALLDDLVWLEKDNAWAKRSSRQMVPTAGLNGAHLHAMRPLLTSGMTVSGYLHRCRDQVVAHRAQYWPGRDVLFEQGGEQLFNTWRPGTLGRDMVSRYEAEGFSVPDDLVGPWLDLVDLVCGVERPVGSVDLLLDWFAALVGDPACRKPGWHVIMQSDRQGMGKDLIMSPVREALGLENWSKASLDMLVGQFDKFTERRLVYAPELETPTSRWATTGSDLYTKLKRWTDNAPGEHSYHGKGKEAYPGPNVCGFVITCNPRNAITLAADDRRFMVFTNNQVPAGKAYYVRVANWLEAGGNEAVAAWLISRWRDMTPSRQDALYAWAPRTAGKHRMTLASDTVSDLIERVLPSLPDLITSEDLLEGEIRAALARKELRAAPGVNAISRILRSLGCEQMAGGESLELPGIAARRRVWAIRNGEKYEGLTGKEVGKLYKSPAETAFPPSF